MATRRTSSADYLTDEILGLIRDDDLQPGERLPSVDALAESYGVASPTVREVLRRLEATGVLEIRHGSGTYVLRSVEPMVVANPHAAAVNAASLANLLQARLLIEPSLARMAADGLDAASQSQLASALAQATSAPHSDPQAFQEGGLGVHRAIARASGNAVLADILESLLEVHSREQLQIQDLYGRLRHDLTVHAEIVSAVTSRAADRAESLMQEHLEEVLSTVLERLAAEDEDTTGSGVPEVRTEAARP